MPITKGVNKRLAYKKESSWGVLAGAASAKYLRRVTADFNLKKETYESAEIRNDYQVSDFRHGVRSAEGSLSGELSPGSYADFMASVVAKDFAAGVVIATLSLTFAVSGVFYTVTRGSGSWISDLVNVGDVCAITAGAVNAANLNNNFLVCSMSATVLTVIALSATAIVAEGPIASCSLTVRGKKTQAPLTGHTDDSYTVEEFYTDIAQSEVYTGMKVGSMAVKLPATGLVTTDFSFMGQNLTQTSTSQYFTSPTAAGTTGIFASVSGALVVNGTPVALITSMDFTVERSLEPAKVVGSNFAAAMFTGRIRCNGNMSVYYQDAVFRDYFNNESLVTIVVALSTDSSKTADVVSFTFPKVKVGSATKKDGENGIVQDHSFVALLNSVTTLGLPATTIQIQDTAS